MEITETAAVPAATKTNQGSKATPNKVTGQAAQFDAFFALNSRVPQGTPTDAGQQITSDAVGSDIPEFMPSIEITIELDKQSKKSSPTASIEGVQAALAFPTAQVGVTPQSSSIPTPTLPGNGHKTLQELSDDELRALGDNPHDQIITMPESCSSDAGILSMPAGAFSEIAEALDSNKFNVTVPAGQSANVAEPDRKITEEPPQGGAFTSFDDDSNSLAIGSPDGRHEAAARFIDKHQFAAAPVNLIANLAVEIGNSSFPAPQRLDATGVTSSNPAFSVFSVKNVKEKTFELRLDPPELGSVRIEIKHLDSGPLKAIISAERPDTLDLLRRHIDVFRAEASKLGFGELDLQFESYQQGNGSSSSKEKLGTSTLRHSFEIGFDDNSSQFAHLSGGMDIWV